MSLSFQFDPKTTADAEVQPRSLPIQIDDLTYVIRETVLYGSQQGLYSYHESYPLGGGRAEVMLWLKESRVFKIQ